MRYKDHLTMQLEEGLGVELLRVQAVGGFPHLPQLVHAALQKDRDHLSSAPLLWLAKVLGTGSYWGVDFGMLSVLLLQLLQPLLLLLPLLLVQTLQVLPPLVLLQHLVALELLVALRVIVLQIFGGLGQSERASVKRKEVVQTYRKSYKLAWTSVKNDDLLKSHLDPSTIKFHG